MPEKDIPLRKRGNPGKDEHFSWFPRFIKALESGKTRGEAAKAAGVTRQSTIYALTHHPELHAEVLDAEEASLEIAGQILYKIMLDDDHPDQFKAAKYVAETRLRQWRRQADRVEVTATLNLNTPTEDLQTRMDRVLARIEQRALSASADEIVDAEIIDPEPEPESETP